MAVSAIQPAGLQAATSQDIKGHQRAIPMRIDFAAILAAVDGPDDSHGPLPTGMSGAEAFRSSVLAGDLRITTIVFGNGTSETRLDEMGADNISVPPPQPAPIVAIPRLIFGALSDLEPEIGIDGRAASKRTREKVTGGRKRETGFYQNDGYTAAAAPRALARITSDSPGRMIDLLV